MAGFNNWAKIAAGLRPACRQVVIDTCKDIATTAQANASRRSGWMADSVYTVTADGSTYGSGGAPPTDDVHLLPELPMLGDDLTGLAAAGANYSVFVDYGTRFMSPEPWFTPAVDAAGSRFDGRLATVWDKVGA